MLHTRNRRNRRVASTRRSPASRRVAVPIFASMLIAAFVLNACASSTGPGTGGVTLWVSNINANTILGYSATQIKSSTSAAPAVVIGTPPGGDGEAIGGNTGIAFDRSGNLWVAEVGTSPNMLLMYASSQLGASNTPKPAVTITSTQPDTFEPTDSAALDVPIAIAFDASGNLWVANDDPQGGTLLEFTTSQLAASGNPRPAVAITGNGVSVSDPQAIAFDRAGNLWVANEADIVEFSASQIGSSGSPVPAVTLDYPSPRIISPSGLAFDHDGDLWVSSNLASALYEFTPSQLLASGNPAPATTLSASGKTGGLSSPVAITFDRSGNLWVTSATNTVSEFLASQLKTSGAPAAALTISGSALAVPIGLAVR
jgi:secreted PhoX family phosphatase